MSRRKKSYGKVKPSWVGKTASSIVKMAEALLDPSRSASVQRRHTDNKSVQAKFSDYAGHRSHCARKRNKEAAQAHPIGSYVKVFEVQSSFIGEVIRVGGGKYTILRAHGVRTRVPYWSHIVELAKSTELFSVLNEMKDNA
jgi:hypothetical protein